VSNRIRNNVIAFEPVNERISKIRIKGKFQNMTLITAHAPTEEKEEREKEGFYETLEKEYERIPKFDTKIILGGMNAQIGREEFHE